MHIHSATWDWKTGVKRERRWEKRFQCILGFARAVSEHLYNALQHMLWFLGLSCAWPGVGSCGWFVWIPSNSEYSMTLSAEGQTTGLAVLKSMLLNT